MTRREASGKESDCRNLKGIWTPQHAVQFSPPPPRRFDKRGARIVYVFIAKKVANLSSSVGHRLAMLSQREI